MGRVISGLSSPLTLAGKPRGFAFAAYEDQRSTVLAVDNLSGARVAGRVIRVEHVDNYKRKKAEVLDAGSRVLGDASACACATHELRITDLALRCTSCCKGTNDGCSTSRTQLLLLLQMEGREPSPDAAAGSGDEGPPEDAAALPPPPGPAHPPAAKAGATSSAVVMLQGCAMVCSRCAVSCMSR